MRLLKQGLRANGKQRGTCVLLCVTKVRNRMLMLRKGGQARASTAAHPPMMQHNIPKTTTDAKRDPQRRRRKSKPGRSNARGATNKQGTTRTTSTRGVDHALMMTKMPRRRSSSSARPQTHAHTPGLLAPLLWRRQCTRRTAAPDHGSSGPTNAPCWPSLLTGPGTTEQCVH